VVAAIDWPGAANLDRFGYRSVSEVDGMVTPVTAREDVNAV
jgi:hypothetical protein